MDLEDAVIVGMFAGIYDEKVAKKFLDEYCENHGITLEESLELIKRARERVNEEIPDWMLGWWRQRGER